MKHFIVIIIILYKLFSASVMSSMQIGSDNATTEFTVQQILSNGDRVASFAWLKSGFLLENLVTTATFDSMFPVSGTVALNAGTLVLNTDLTFANVSSLYTLGNIVGNSHSVDLSPSMTVITSISSSTSLVNTYTLELTTALGAQNVTTKWSFDSQFVAVGLNTGGSDQEIRLYSYNGTALTFLAGVNLGVAVLTTAWHPTQYWLAVGYQESTGHPALTIYSINPASPNLSTVLATYTLSATTFWVNSARYHPSGNFLAIGTSDTTQDIVVFPVNSNGTLNTANKITVVFSGATTPDTESLGWNTTGQYLGVGCANSSGTFPELRVYDFVFTGTVASALTLSASLLLGEVAGLEWSHTNTYQIFTALATTPALAVYNFSSVPGTLTQAAYLAQPTLVREIVLDPTAPNVGISCNWNGGVNTIFFYAYNLTGTGIFTTVYQAASQPSNNTDALGWSPNGQYIAYGDDGGTYYVVNKEGIATLSTCVTFSNVYINLSNDLYLQNACITFAGNCTINGNGNTMTILSTSTVSIGTNSQLRLSNITVSGVNNQNFSTFDNTGSCIFENTNLYMSGNYNWDSGYFVVEDMFKIQGPGKTFIYSTNLVSTVSSFSSLMMDYQTTFSYAPVSNSNSLIKFLDNTGIFKLFNASLSVSSAGLAFTQGTFMVDGSSSIFNTASSIAQGVSFGDGISAANDTTINILPAAVLNLMSGYLVYQNV